jgi:hypothetical protein
VFGFIEVPPRNFIPVTFSGPSNSSGEEGVLLRSPGDLSLRFNEV